MVQLATWFLTTVSLEDPPILLLLVVDKESVLHQLLMRVTAEELQSEMI